ncbi:helix-turn-helix domain-containing protein [Streptomyces sp. SCSIO 30461]|uniref:TetR/AcrR family transcriptional regulator n=1 Tax=Streptomyces sp. SCSIO 30461 TaxID=3118085 RepID=UPI0030D2EA9E
MARMRPSSSAVRSRADQVRPGEYPERRLVVDDLDLPPLAGLAARLAHEAPVRRQLRRDRGPEESVIDQVGPPGDGCAFGEGGHEGLLDGGRAPVREHRCLHLVGVATTAMWSLMWDRKGYARTRARDVAAAAGVSTSAIGYHFGTTDALLDSALLDGLEGWSATSDARLRDVPRHPVRERIAQSWASAVDSFSGYRGLLAASFELIARADDDPETQRRLRAAVIGARRELAQQLLGLTRPRTRRSRSRRVPSATSCSAGSSSNG